MIDHSLSLPQDLGAGMLGGLLLEDGLYLRYGRFTCREDLQVLRPARQTSSGMIFSLCYQNNDIFLSANNMPFSLTVPAGNPCDFIELLMDWEWLQQHLAGMEEKVRGIECALVGDTSTFLQDRTKTAEEHLLGEIGVELARCRINLLSLRGRLLLLLSGTISRWPAPGNTQPSIRKTWHMQTIREVEQRLVHSLEDMLPPQRQLAREFALSESTLKRHFKAVYGKTMYEYYLEKKMELAKRLLQERKISVTETAYMLGYEKVSAFISMFKKVHKVSPGSLK
jgi:AraC-like DNA-binding protein